MTFNKHDRSDPVNGNVRRESKQKRKSMYFHWYLINLSLCGLVNKIDANDSVRLYAVNYLISFRLQNLFYILLLIDKIILLRKVLVTQLNFNYLSQSVIFPYIFCGQHRNFLFHLCFINHSMGIT